MTAGKLIEELRLYDPDTRIFLVHSEAAKSSVLSSITTAYYSEDSDEIYNDPDDAIENEAVDWGGELEEVVAIVVD